MKPAGARPRLWQYPALGAAAGLLYGLGTWNVAAGVLLGVVAAGSAATSDYLQHRHPAAMAAYRRGVWKLAPVIIVVGLLGFVLFLVEL